MNTITKNPLKLIKNIVIFIGIIAYSSLVFAANYEGKMINLEHKEIKLRFALTKVEHTKGLSGLKPNQFSMKEGMLFVNKEMGPRKFWMPDTYFNLDIIFLDQDLKIVGIEKDVLAHPGMNTPPEIVTTQIYNAQFILEVKSKNPFSKNLKTGDQLIFKGNTNLSEIVSKIHPEQ